MKKVKIKAHAKVNLTLDILGVKDGFHTLKSLVCSIDLADTIVLKARKDKNITLSTTGIPMDCKPTLNNAYKTAKLFSTRFLTNGVDIKVDKKIPLGAGLGGSSADIAGVLNGMQMLYPGKHDITWIANYLGSDSSYMLKGGYAILQGRGDEVNYRTVNEKLYFVILTCEKGVTAKQSYAEYDRLNEKSQSVTEKALLHLTKKEYKKFFECLKNDLYIPSKNIEPEIYANMHALKLAGAEGVVMTGSGSAVCGVFVDKKERDKVYNKLSKLYKGYIIKAQTTENEE